MHPLAAAPYPYMGHPDGAKMQRSSTFEPSLNGTVTSIGYKD